MVDISLICGLCLLFYKPPIDLNIHSVMPINLPKSKNISYCVFVFSFFIVSNFVGNAQVEIGNSNPDSSSILDMTSTTQRLLTSRMTSSEKDIIFKSEVIFLIYNTKTILSENNSVLNQLKRLSSINSFSLGLINRETIRVGKYLEGRIVEISDLTPFFYLRKTPKTNLAYRNENTIVIFNIHQVEVMMYNSIRFSHKINRRSLSSHTTAV